MRGVPGKTRHSHMAPMDEARLALDRTSPPLPPVVSASAIVNEQSASATIRSVLTPAEGPVSDGRWRLSDDAILLIVHDGSARLIDLAGNVCAVTESGAAMLTAALRDGVEPACRALASRYGVDAERIHADMETFFLGLEAQDLLVKPRAVRRRSPVKRAVSWMFYPFVLLCARRPRRWMRAKAWSLIVLAFAATRMLNWTEAVRVWDRAGSRLIKNAVADHHILAAIDSVVTEVIARHPLTVGCKERALCCWVLARAGGKPARIQLGVDLFPFGLHCWCEHESQIVADRYEGRCDRYTPILVYG
jgi:hypothetical protein